MPLSLLIYTHFFRLDMDWQAWIVRGMRRAAEQLSAPDLIPFCDAAMNHIEAAFALRDSFRLAQKPTLNAEEVRELDGAIDEFMSGAYRTLDVQAGMKRSLHAAASRGARDAAFPAGLKAHTHTTRIEKAYLNERAVKALQSPAHEAEVARVGLADQLAEVAPKVTQFSNAVGATAPVTGAMVAAAEALSEQALLFVVFKALSRFDWAIPAEAAKRDQLLLPLRSANEELHRVYTSRRKAKGQEEGKAPTDTTGSTPAEGTSQASPPAAADGGAPATEAPAEPFPQAPETITPVNTQDVLSPAVNQ